MENKSLYVLAGYDDLTEKRLSEMQNRLYDLKFEGVQTKNIPMHFTLGSYDTDREEELIARLNRLSGNFEAFGRGHDAGEGACKPESEVSRQHGSGNRRATGSVHKSADPRGSAHRTVRRSGREANDF